MQNTRTIQPTATAGQFKMITNDFYNDGSPRTGQTIVYDTEEQANQVAIAQKNWWGSNLVLMGNNEYDVNGKKYFEPTYNLYD